jgi:predicted nucleotidyltransferase
MNIIGIIAEYNPFHNGHLYHLNKIKEMFPDSLIILVLNGYFLERGEISLLSKEDKIKIALDNNVDIVTELPFVFGSQSADTFALRSIQILNELGTNYIVFGSESNDLKLLEETAKKQLENDFNENVKNIIAEGNNYPTALNKSIGININKPNDLLGVSYLKTILQNNYNIKPITIKRTNDYHDKTSNDLIISASNIREKFNNNLDVSKYTNYSNCLKKVDNKLLFNLLKYKILTDHNLKNYLTVDEGIENKLIKEINNTNSLDELINKIKSKRYTYNRLNRMMIHILIGLTKEDNKKIDFEYIKILGFNNNGKNYLNKIKSPLLIQRKISNKYLLQKYELKASLIYDLLTSSKTIEFEKSNKPIKKNID